MSRNHDACGPPHPIGNSFLPTALNLTAAWTLAILSHPKTQLSPLAPINAAMQDRAFAWLERWLKA